MTLIIFYRLNIYGLIVIKIDIDNIIKFKDNIIFIKPIINTEEFKSITKCKSPKNLQVNELTR